MVTLQQIQRGLFKYVKNDLVPKADGARKIALIAFVNLASEETAFANIASMALEYMEHPIIKALNVTTANSEVDIDKLYNAITPAFDGGTKHTVHIPVLGPLILDRSDVDKLHRYIVGG